MTATRAHLPNITDDRVQIDNPGLALDAYVPFTGAAQGAHLIDRARAIECIVGAGVPELYRAAYARWTAAIARLPHLVTATFTPATALVVGLGAETVHETGISLLRPYGVPFLPGTALKGLAHRYARDAAKSSDPSGTALTDAVRTVLFGVQNQAAYCTFLDARYIPGSAPTDRPQERAPADRPLRLDTITVHHPCYYRSAGGPNPEDQPTDFDDPTPVAFLSAVGSYYLAISGPTREWSEAAMTVLLRALGSHGVGAKTSSGYGRPARVGSHEQRTDTVRAWEPGPTYVRELVETVLKPDVSPSVVRLIAQIERLPPDHVPPQIANFATRLMAEIPEADVAGRRQVAAVIRERLRSVRKEPWLRDPSRRWAVALQPYLDETDAG
jgi:CRISPR-associated protein Cmr6